MGKVVSRTYDIEPGNSFESPDGNTRIERFSPRDERPYAGHGLDTEIRIGKTDFQKLGEPKAIRVTFTTLY